MVGEAGPEAVVPLGGGGDLLGGTATKENTRETSDNTKQLKMLNDQLFVMLHPSAAAAVVASAAVAVASVAASAVAAVGGGGGGGGGGRWRWRRRSTWQRCGAGDRRRGWRLVA